MSQIFKTNKLHSLFSGDLISISHGALISNVSFIVPFQIILHQMMIKVLIITQFLHSVIKLYKEKVNFSKEPKQILLLNCSP